MEENNRRNSDVQIAVLTERLHTFIESQTSWQETIIESRKADREILDHITNELSVYKTIYKTVKFIGMALVACATFKFGDISGIWHKLFGG